MEYLVLFYLLIIYVKKATSGICVISKTSVQNFFSLRNSAFCRGQKILCSYFKA
jgi:hypothetical protein